MTDVNFPSISVGFPVYNEEKTVGEVLHEAHKLLSNSGLDYEILVCNDSSTDRSWDIIKDLASQFPRFRVINHLHNLGIRETFEHLNKEAKGDFVFINAVDKQWDTAILFKMLPLTKTADIIIASRKDKHYGLWRMLISWFFNVVPLILFGVRTFDAGAVKLVKREIIEKFSLVSKSPFLEAERLIRAARAGYRIVQYPVNISPRKTGSSHAIRLPVLLDVFKDIFRTWHSILFSEPKND